jgi:hypothetical protein
MPLLFLVQAQLVHARETHAPKERKVKGRILGVTTNVEQLNYSPSKKMLLIKLLNILGAHTGRKVTRRKKNEGLGNVPMLVANFLKLNMHGFMDWTARFSYRMGRKFRGLNFRSFGAKV